MTPVYIGLGGNEGDLRQTFRNAVEMLNRELGSAGRPEIAPIYETPAIAKGITLCPQYFEKDTPHFWNTVVRLETDLSAEDVFEKMLAIEKTLGRDREKETGISRPVDLDLLFYGNWIIRKSEDRLVVPHPRAHQRSFVMIPMRDLAPDYVHPTFKMSIAELCERPLKPEEIRCVGQVYE